MARDPDAGPHLDIFVWILGVWEVSQSTGNCSEIDFDEFSAQEVPYSLIFKHFQNFGFCLIKIEGPDAVSGPPFGVICSWKQLHEHMHMVPVP